MVRASERCLVVFARPTAKSVTIQLAVIWAISDTCRLLTFVCRRYGSGGSLSPPPAGTLTYPFPSFPGSVYFRRTDLKLIADYLGEKPSSCYDGDKILYFFFVKRAGRVSPEVAWNDFLYSYFETNVNSIRTFRTSEFKCQKCIPIFYHIMLTYDFTLFGY